MAVTHVTRSFEFAAVHALHTGARRERPHGHRYRLEVTLSARADAELEAAVDAHVLAHLHARDIDRVTGGPSTGERLVEWIDARLRATPLRDRLRAVVLRETAKNRFVSAASEDRYV